MAVTASPGYVVVDRRRIALVEPGMPAAPVEHHCGSLDDAAAARLVAEVRASALRATSASLDLPARSVQVLAECAHDRRWEVHLFSTRDVQAHAGKILGERAGDVLGGQRAKLGPPWAKDHMIAFAATIAAS